VTPGAYVYVVGEILHVWRDNMKLALERLTIGVTAISLIIAVGLIALLLFGGCATLTLSPREITPEQVYY
jgi:hypothetical protein